MVKVYDKEISALGRVLEEVRTGAENYSEGKNNKGEVTMLQTQILLYIASHPGVTSKVLEQAMGMSQSSTSRNARALSKWRAVTPTNPIPQPGAHYIEFGRDIYDARGNAHFLTPRGIRVMRKVISLLTGKPADDFDPPRG